MPDFDKVTALSLVEGEAVLSNDEPYLAGWLQRVCRVAARHVPAYGVGISLVNEHSLLMTAAASGESSAALEELQLTLGEGPALEVCTTRWSVLVPDLGARATTSWTVYAPAARDHGVASVFAFPLRINDDAPPLGAFDVYCSEPGELSREERVRAEAFAEAATAGLVSATESAGDLLGDLARGGYWIYQAQGMVMVQLGVPADEALVRLRAFAFAHDRRLADVARDVIERRLALEPDQPE